MADQKPGSQLPCQKALLDAFFAEIRTFKKSVKAQLKDIQFDEEIIASSQKNYLDILVNDIKAKLNYINIYKLDIQKLSAVGKDGSALDRFLQQQKN